MKKLVSLMMIFALVLGMATVVNAAPATANLKVTLDKQTAKVGEEVVVTVNWTEKMEAVDLELGFDKTKVEFVSASISEDYIATNRIADGVVQISWFSMNGQGITNITYKFKVIAEGSAKFTTAEAVLSDENVEQPENYVYGTATLNEKTNTPSTDKPSTDKPSTDKPSTDKPSTDKPSTDKPSTDKPSTDKPSTDKPSTDTPSTDKPSTDTPSTDKPSTDKPSTDKPSTDKPSTDTPSTDNPSANKPNTSKPSTSKPTAIPPAGAKVIEYAMIALVVVVAMTVALVVVKNRKNK